MWLMTLHEMELRILKLEHAVKEMLTIKPMFEKLILQGEEQIKSADSVIIACQEIQMDIAKMMGGKDANAV